MAVKVLVVDDNKMERSLISVALKKYDYEIVQAEDGYGALACLEKEDVNIVISDWMMPGMDGLELCRQIRGKKSPGGYVYIIMVTSRAEKGDLMEGFGAGVDAYLYKPIDIRILDVQIKAGIRIITLEQDLLREKKKVSLYAADMENLARERAEQLIHADRMANLGMMAAGIAHEINNPATFISGNIQTFEKFWNFLKSYLENIVSQVENIVSQVEKSEAQIEKRDSQTDNNACHVEKSAPGDGSADNAKLKFIMQEMPGIIKGLHDGTRRIRRIVGGLKSYSRQDRPHFSKAHIHNIIDDALLLCHNVLKHHVKVKKDFSVSTPSVFCDPYQIEQVMINLFNNAAYAMKDKKDGLLTVKTMENQGHVVVTVEDNGNGLGKDVLDKIWNPFYTTKPAGIGTGLGMSISQGIIKNHGGSISAANSSRGGAVFTLKLPSARNDDES
ncbi:MAG: response regulator [Desulfamplus sp.]|nr:response regulator [Desulfamplus sp.]